VTFEADASFRSATAVDQHAELVIRELHRVATKPQTD